MHTFKVCPKTGIKGNSLGSKLIKTLLYLPKKLCRIIYIIFVTLRTPTPTIEVILTAIFIPILAIEIWAFFWFMCALDDLCYSRNAPINLVGGGQ